MTSKHDFKNRIFSFLRHYTFHKKTLLKELLETVDALTLSFVELNTTRQHQKFRLRSFVVT